MFNDIYSFKKNNIYKFNEAFNFIKLESIKKISCLKNVITLSESKTKQNQTLKFTFTSAESSCSISFLALSICLLIMSRIAFSGVAC